MKEELKGPKVENVSVAIVKEEGEGGENIFNVYLINQKEEALEQVIVASRGYLNTADGQTQKKTDTIRKLLGNIPGQSTAKIEPIMESVLALNNEYWVSFWIGDQVYDKKYVFLAESVTEENFITIPLLEKQGTLVG